MRERIFAGLAHMGVGSAKGPGKAEAAAKMAIQRSLLETSISGARGIIVSITGPADIGFDEVEEASSMICKEAHVDANIIWGAAFDETLDDEIRVTVVATGFDAKPGAAKEKEGRRVVDDDDLSIITEQKSVPLAEEEKEMDELATDEDALINILSRNQKKTYFEE